MYLTIQFIELCLGASSAAFVLSLFWYKATQRDKLDRGTVVFFAKLWYGIGVTCILLGILLKYT